MLLKPPNTQVAVMAQHKTASKKSRLNRLNLSLCVGLCLYLFQQHVKAADNPYQQHYIAQSEQGLRSMQASPDTQIYHGTKRDADNISMLESGYDFMGASRFDANDISPELAVAQGKAIKADTVLVYVKKAGGKTPDSQMQMFKEAVKAGKELTEKDLGGTDKKFSYFASYWAKLPTPTLGVHIIKLVPQASVPDPDEESKEAVDAGKGLQVLAVIKNSPAEKAGLLRGDRLIKINDTLLNQPADLMGAVKQQRGQTVKIQFLRNEAEQMVEAVLN